MWSNIHVVILVKTSYMYLRLRISTLATFCTNETMSPLHMTTLTVIISISILLLNQP